ncbi:MAG: hypothetical protein BWY26_01262 [Elusimicrobia bacterium ADurb.Bin231]|nr:MAG: hypothetical protein BWY26_01262 [Elusimicrobia bacterium ADurb.Bin231]
MGKIKLIEVEIPDKIARALEQIAEEQYKSISILVREMIVDYIEDELSIQSWKTIEKGRKEYREGEYTPWREALHG